MWDTTTGRSADQVPCRDIVQESHGSSAVAQGGWDTWLDWEVEATFRKTLNVLFTILVLWEVGSIECVVCFICVILSRT